MLFIGTFFICLFIFMMQFLWRYVDELVGKGLEMSVLAQFFFYSALTLIPLSLPLAILLAALMTFGNFGERYELLSMKAAGIPLLRIIRPLIIFCTFLCCTSFYFQNVIAPKAQIKLLTLLVSMKQTSPELDIPEGVFYDEIEGYNIYVKQKDRETGMLKDVLIYNFSDGFENAHIIWASEGKMEMTADKQHLYLHLYNGEQFENLKSQTISSNNVPYRRETFREKHTIIEFDGGFNMVDGSFLSDRSDSKNMIEISQSIDSLNHRADSLGRSMYNEIKASTYRNIVLSKTDSAKIVETNNKINVDSLFNSYTLAEKDKTLGSAADRTEALASEWSMKSYQTTDADNNIRKHEADWHKKITLSLSCLIFFFIGAPLGAIIRKGGLGVPVVISVTIFIFYYIINVSGEKMAKSGEWVPWFGEWLSSMVLCPIGIFLTYKANKDSAVFNIEAYINVIRKILGLRISRHIARKEVIIHDPDYPVVKTELTALSQEWQAYAQKSRLRLPPNYLHIFFHNIDDHEVISLSRKMENLITILSNSRDAAILDALNKLPIVSTHAHTRPFHNYKWNMVLGIIFPVGIFFYFRIWRYRLRLYKDIQQIKKYSAFIAERIEKISEIE